MQDCLYVQADCDYILGVERNRTTQWGALVNNSLFPIVPYWPRKTMGVCSLAASPKPSALHYTESEWIVLKQCPTVCCSATVSYCPQIYPITLNHSLKLTGITLPTFEMLNSSTKLFGFREFTVNQQNKLSVLARTSHKAMPPSPNPYSK